MNSINLVNTLKERALTFLKYAKKAYEEGDYDFSIFNIEQYLQLSLKAIILRLTGYIPKTHSIKHLLALLVEILKKLSREEYVVRIENLLKHYRKTLEKIDEAYTGARYLMKKYSREDVEKVLKVCEKISNLVNEIESKIFT